MYWSPVLPVGTALEGGEGGEFHARSGERGEVKRLEEGRVGGHSARHM